MKTKETSLPYYLSVRVSPIDGLVLMWHIPTELSSAWSQTQSQCSRSLSEPLPRAVIFLIVKLRKGFSQLLFVYVVFSFNIFLFTYFCVVSSFELPLDHNTIHCWWETSWMHIFLKRIRAGLNINRFAQNLNPLHISYNVKPQAFL